MRQCLASILMSSLLLVTASAALGDDPSESGERQLERTVETTVPVTMKYLLYVPDEYEQRDKWPLVLFLHGAGERGDDLEKVKRHGPPKLIKAGKEFPFILVAPQCPAERWWRPFELTALLDEIIKTHNVDEDRVYVTGLSMGGYGTWDLAILTPERFAAIAPICGGGIPYRAKRIAKVPIWVFHGAKDTVVPVKKSEEMIKALKKAGGAPKFTVYPEAGHDSWTAAYEDPAFFEWLLRQERGGSGEAGDRAKSSRE